MKSLWSLLAVVGVGCAHESGSAHLPSTSQVGFAALELTDPVSHEGLKATVFYPLAQPAGPGHTTVGPYDVEANEGGAPASTRHPLVLISHGHAGSRWGHHDLATFLATRGYVVATVEHLGDSWNDQRTFLTGASVLGRPRQVSAVLDAVLEHPTYGPLIDRQRIGVAGFSAGGATSLMLLGATVDVGRLGPYCQKRPQDTDFCGHRETRAVASSTAPVADPRVTAAFVMAPVGVFFSNETLAAISAPVFVAVADRDEVLPPAEHADAVAQALTHRLGTARVPAGHFVFLAPCNEAFAHEAPQLCVDGPGVDRRAIHQALNAQAADFFAHAW